jgi:hypothetical protein
VLFHTPLFTFVRPLALLIFNNLTCFVCFCNKQAFTSRLDRGSKNGHEMMRRILKCVRTHDLRSNADAVARNAEDERSPISLHLTESALAVFCSRPCAIRSTVDNWHVRTHALRSNAGPFPAAYK